MLPKILRWIKNNVTVFLWTFVEKEIRNMTKRFVDRPPFEKHLAAYRKATKKERGKILDDFERVYKRPRKSLIRSFNRLLGYSKKKPKNKNEGHKRPRGRPTKYTNKVNAAIETLLEAYNFPSAERIHSFIPEAIRIFKRDSMWKYDEKTTNLLINMPLGSLKPRVAKISRSRGLMRGFSTTRPSKIFKDIPVYLGDWSKEGAGYGQIDTVVHSGPRLEGIMAYTVNFVDVATYWQEPVAQLNKGELATKKSLQIIKSRVPFPIKGLHPDSGSEFINYTLKKWCSLNHIQYTRSRPSKKNDNCYIEQRNDVVVRKYVGYERYDCEVAVTAMNELYSVIRLYVNYFQPSFKLISKTKLTNGKWKYTYDTPATPYQRVLARKDIPESTKMELKDEYETLNPKLLLDKIKTLTIKLQKIQKEAGYHF